MIRSFLLAAVLGASMASVAHSQPQNQPPFEPSLMRLSEVLGSLHYLKNLCGEPGPQWRELMEKLITAEAPTEARKAQFIASFNRGYRSFASIYSTCTDQAATAFERYRAEGEKLAGETATRFGN
jgi:uncharacterized protein (TIGR02301 family)